MEKTGRDLLAQLVRERSIDGLTVELSEANAILKDKETEIAQLKRSVKERDDAVDERDKCLVLMKDLQRLVREQEQDLAQDSTEATRVSEDRLRLQLQTVAQSEWAHRSDLMNQYSTFWQDIIMFPLMTLQTLFIESILLDAKVIYNSANKHLSEVSTMRQVISDMERERRGVELKLGTGQHQERRLEHEKAALLDEVAQYRLRLEHCESEFCASVDRQTELSVRLQSTEEKLNSTLELAEDSCQTVSEQSILLTQLRRRLASQASSVGELIRACNVQLIGGVEAPRLSQSRALLRDVLYDIAAARRADSDSTVINLKSRSPPRHVDGMDANESVQHLEVAFQKVKNVLERCLDPTVNEWVIFERPVIQAAVRKVELSINE
jgi:hypothetical protein